MIYKKTDENGNITYSECKVIKLNGIWISNPTVEQITEDGWEEFSLNNSLEDIIQEEKENKIFQSDEYADSEEVKYVYLNGNKIWATPSERDNYLSTLQSAQRLGVETINFMGITLSVSDAISLLDRVNLWAFQVTNIKNSHKNNISNLTTLEEIQNYDYTLGYPEQLTFTF